MGNFWNMESNLTIKWQLKKSQSQPDGKGCTVSAPPIPGTLPAGISLATTLESGSGVDRHVS